jgi:hypothetical protein
VDSRVRVQLSPSPVDHEKYTIRFNQRFIFVKNKKKKIYTFPHTIHVSPPLVSMDALKGLEDEQN